VAARFILVVLAAVHFHFMLQQEHRDRHPSAQRGGGSLFALSSAGAWIRPAPRAPVRVHSLLGFSGLPALLADFKASTIIPFLTQNVALGSTIYTDALKSFAGLAEVAFQHVARNQPLRSELRKGEKSVVPLADQAIGDLQQWLIGTHHGVSKAQLQVYLDEFVFRHNRRKTPAAAFQTLLGLGTARKSAEYEQIRGARDLNHII
jgi:transposase-like protein